MRSLVLLGLAGVAAAFTGPSALPGELQLLPAVMANVQARDISSHGRRQSDE
jgi:hypothetical protein